MERIFKVAEITMIALVIMCMLTGVIYHGIIAGSLGVMGWVIGIAMTAMAAVLLVLACVEDDEDEIDDECEPFNIE